MKFESDLRRLSPTFILRLGVGFVLVYAGINTLIYPEFWTQFVPGWMTAIMPIGTFLVVYSIFELILGFAILFGRLLATASMIAFWNMIFILVFYGVNHVSFSGFGVALASLALFFIVIKERELLGGNK